MARALDDGGNVMSAKEPRTQKYLRACADLVEHMRHADTWHPDEPENKVGLFVVLCDPDTAHLDIDAINTFLAKAQEQS